MERVRAVSPVTSEESAPPEVIDFAPGAAPLCLRERVEVVASPGVTREDVESLFDGLSAPLAPGESTRERADQLLRLIQDEVLGELSSRDERQVRPAALEALVGLGFPYALEVPPEVLARMRASVPRALSLSSRWGLGLAVVAPLLPLVYSPWWWWDRHLDVLGIVGGAMWLPAALSALAERYRIRWLKDLCTGLLAVESMGGLIPGSLWLTLEGPSWGAFTVLGVGVALMASAICLRHRPEMDD